MKQNSLKKILAATTLAAAVGFAAPANAATIQLGFILDSSGSIGVAGWNTIRLGLSNAILAEIPVGGPDTYEVSVVSFSTGAVANVQAVLIDSVAARAAVAATVATLPFQAGGTNFGPAFSLMQTTLANSTNTTLGNSSLSYVNFATDGVQGDIAAGFAARQAIIAAGVDNISIEGIGGADAVDLQNNYCYPGPCDTSSPFNFPAQGFYIGVATATDYANAIGNKIAVVTGGTVPEPASMTLLGLGLAGLVARRLRKKA